MIDDDDMSEREEEIEAEELDQKQAHGQKNLDRFDPWLTQHEKTNADRSNSFFIHPAPVNLRIRDTHLSLI
jgi:hypothetical protein